MNPAQQIIELLRKIQQKIEEILRLVNKVLSLIPAILSWVADRLREEWDKLMVKLGEIWDWIVDKLSYVGDPALLNSSSATWAEVGGRVARINDTITDQALTTEDEWSGRGKDQYVQSLEPQRRANTSILSDYAERISSALSTMATGIIAFWAAVVVALLTLIGTIVVTIVTAKAAAAATAATLGAAAPSMVVPIVTIVVGAVVCLGSLAAGWWVLSGQADSAKATLALTSSGITAWPKIATS
ncbi:hypothetical protein [Microbacterium sp.]|uniref:hypothetical protein n=1 Tax=Microbacterium sp. TaxID=51671 RepID=UPI0039E3F467